MFQTLSTSYASEVVPTVLRPYVTAYVCMCWGAGILLSSGVVRAVAELEGDLGETQNSRVLTDRADIAVRMAIALRFAMDLAASPLHRCIFRPRVAMERCQTKETRNCAQSATESPFRRTRWRQEECGLDLGIHPTHDRPGRSRDCQC